MSHRRNQDKKSTETLRDGLDGPEILLRTEVAFWREMIGSCDADYPTASLERMRQSLALAEYRLMRCFEAHVGLPGAKGSPDPTSGQGAGSIH